MCVRGVVVWQPSFEWCGIAKTETDERLLSASTRLGGLRRRLEHCNVGTSSLQSSRVLLISL